MIPTSSNPVVDVFRQYVKLYKLRNSNAGELDSGLEREWKEISFTLESIFSGLYSPDPDDFGMPLFNKTQIRSHLPVDFLRVPTDTDVLCETTNSFFSGKLQDISTGGAYVHASVPFELETKVRLTFCTFRDAMPLELDGRVAWYNAGGSRKRCLREGAGVQFVECEGLIRNQVEEFVYELVEETLVRANLL